MGYSSHGSGLSALAVTAHITCRLTAGSVIFFSGEVATPEIKNGTYFALYVYISR